MAHEEGTGLTYGIPAPLLEDVPMLQEDSGSFFHFRPESALQNNSRVPCGDSRLVEKLKTDQCTFYQESEVYDC